MLHVRRPKILHRGAPVGLHRQRVTNVAPVDEIRRPRDLDVDPAPVPLGLRRIAVIGPVRSATGPFETLEQATGKPHSIILEKRGHWIAPGHNSIITDAAGQDWIVYHAVDLRHPREKPTDDLYTRRVMLIDRISWRNGWPLIVGPSEDLLPAPVTSRLRRN